MIMKKLSKLNIMLFIAFLVAGLFPCAFSEEAARDYSKPYHLIILGTSDIHGNVWGFSYEDNKETDNNGLARLWTYVRQQRELYPNLYLIDCGDAIQGSIMTDDLFNKYPDKRHPVIKAFNYMKYDAMTLGNHEFNQGTDNLKQILSQADFPVLAANAVTNGRYTSGAGNVIYARDGVKVGIIGVVTPYVSIWDATKPGIDETVFEAANTAVKKEIEKIKDETDIIVVCAHMGMYAEFDEENGADSAQKILDDNPEIDLLPVGHAHILVNEKQGMTVIGGPRNGGRDIVRFDLTLDADNRVIDSSVDVIDMKDIEPAQDMRALIQDEHQDTIVYIQGGPDSDGNNGSELGSTTARFQPENEIRGIPEGRIRDTAVMDLINLIQLENAQADVSASALFKDTSDLPEGGINYSNIFNIYKYDNTLCRVEISGAELKAYMEWAAACYAQWQPGDINIAFDSDHPGYLYDMFAGVDYEIDLSQPAGSRIKNVMFHGEPLKDTQRLKLAVNNYRYSSTLKADELVEGTKEWESSCCIRDMIVAYFADHSPVAPVVDNNWRIVGIDLSEDDPERDELIALINAGMLDTPYYKAYNLSDYDTLVSDFNK